HVVELGEHLFDRLRALDRVRVAEQERHEARDLRLVVHDEDPADGRHAILGSATITFVPLPGADSNVMRPPCSSMIRRLIPSPNPAPAGRVVKNGSPRRATTSGVIPWPSSSIVSRASPAPASSSRRTAIRPAAGVACAALRTRLITTC